MSGNRGTRNKRLPTGATLDLDFEALFLEFELREFRSFHQINNLFNLFKVQVFAFVELISLG